MKEEIKNDNDQEAGPTATPENSEVKQQASQEEIVREYLNGVKRYQDLSEACSRIQRSMDSKRDEGISGEDDEVMVSLRNEFSAAFKLEQEAMAAYVALGDHISPESMDKYLKDKSPEQALAALNEIKKNGQEKQLTETESEEKIKKLDNLKATLKDWKEQNNRAAKNIGNQQVVHFLDTDSLLEQIKSLEGELEGGSVSNDKKAESEKMANSESPEEEIQKLKKSIYDFDSSRKLHRHDNRQDKASGYDEKIKQGIARLKSLQTGADVVVSQAEEGKMIKEISDEVTIAGAQDIRGLLKNIAQEKISATGSDGHVYSPDELIGIINDVVVGKKVPRYITSSMGLRRKVQELLDIEAIKNRK